MPRRPDETPSIGEQISRLNGLLERIASDLAGEMQAIDDEAVVRTTAAIRAANDRRRDVLARLAELEDAQAVLRRHGVSSADEPVETAPYESFAPSVSTHRRERTAGDVILSVLAEAGKPLPAFALDQAVVAVGWSVHASVKAKTNLKRAGLIDVNAGKQWTITDAGLNKVG